MHSDFQVKIVCIAKQWGFDIGAWAIRIVFIWLVFTQIWQPKLAKQYSAWLIKSSHAFVQLLDLFPFILGE